MSNLFRFIHKNAPLGRIQKTGLVLVTLMLAATPLRGEDARPRDAFVDAVRRVRPSVVGVGSYNPTDAPSVLYFGTGFIVGDGSTVATNAHVVQALRERDRLDKMKIFFPDGAVSGQPARVLGEDAFHDVAIIHLEGPPAPALEFSPDAGAQGQTIGMMGYPIGLQLGLVPAVHRGVISAVVPAVLPLPRGAKLTPELAEAIRRPYQLYQLDLVAFPGNSGSPLFDGADGRVIGIINKTLATKTREHLLATPSGITYAVPSRWIQELLIRSTASSNAPTGSDAGSNRP